MKTRKFQNDTKTFELTGNEIVALTQSFNGNPAIDNFLRDKFREQTHFFNDKEL
jgi:hypothetical protein